MVEIHQRLERLHETTSELMKAIKLRTRVQGIEALARGTAVHTVALNGAHEEHLRAEDREDALRVDEAWVAKVVEAIAVEDGRACIKPCAM